MKSHRLVALVRRRAGGPRAGRAAGRARPRRRHNLLFPGQPRAESDRKLEHESERAAGRSPPTSRAVTCS